jgi:hydrogenase/urease accessory protein HupE
VGAVCLLAAGLAGAHDLGLARLELHEAREGRYALRAVVTRPFDPARLTPELPGHCVGQGMQVAPQGPNRIELGMTIDCGEAGMGPADEIGLPWGRSGALVSIRWVDGTLSRRFIQGETSEVRLAIGALRSSPRSRVEVIREYIAFGIEHILTGWDHLAFVLALCLLTAGLPLVRAVTAFTLGHSISLSLAVLGWISIPIAPVEVCIALSVAYLAREALCATNGSQPETPSGTAIVAGFGLLHGLGFASALEEAGMAEAELWVGLLGFNLGVEIGQLLFVAMIVASVALMGPLPRPAFRSWTANAIGVLGVYWAFVRVAAWSG